MIIAQYSAHNGENANPLASQKRQGGWGISITPMVRWFFIISQLN